MFHKPLLLAVVAALLAAGTAGAQTYPDRLVKVIVPVGPGSSTDVVIRIIQPFLEERLKGQKLIIENKPGAGGIIGAESAAKAQSDGYTLLLGASGPMAGAPTLYKETRYDPENDFVPVSFLGEFAFVLVVPAQTSVRNLGELLKYAGTNRTTWGRGNAPGQLLGAQLAIKAKFETAEVAYKSEVEVATALMRGDIAFAFMATTTARPFVEARSLVPIAIGTGSRSVLMPDVPTMAEAGMPEYLPIKSWVGLFAPAKTPRDVVEKLSSEMQMVLNLPDVREKLKSIDFRPQGSDSAWLAAYLKEQLQAWKTVAQSAGIQPQ